MSSYRRKLLSERRQEKKEKTIIAKDFSPNGAKFFLHNGEFDIDAQTIVADITLDNAVAEFQCILDIGLGIHEWSSGQTFAFHNYFPKEKGQNVYRNEFLSGNSGKAEKMDYDLKGQHLRIAVNGNGYFMNGVSVLNLNQNAKSVFEQIMEKIRQEQRIEIGSQEGEGRSYAVYNEVSIYHRCMSVDELKKITEKEEMS